MIFDVGHGGGSFLWRIAVPAIKAGFLPDSISTDLHIGSMNAGMKDMLNVMDKFLAMGLSLDDVMLRSTWNPAKEIGHDELGHLSPGAVADIGVFRRRERPLRLRRYVWRAAEGDAEARLRADAARRQGRLRSRTASRAPTGTRCRRITEQTGDARWDAVTPAPVRAPIRRP